MPQMPRYHLIISQEPPMMRKNLQLVSEKRVALCLISQVFEKPAELDKIMAECWRPK